MSRLTPITPGSTAPVFLSFEGPDRCSAAGGVVFTGATGEEYARHLENALVVQSSEPSAIVYHLKLLGDRPLEEALRREARRTAESCTWPKVANQLVAALECAFASRGSKAD